MILGLFFAFFAPLRFNEVLCALGVLCGEIAVQGRIEG
jgi:hypothetical protein